jgi:hypothetical protein
MTLHGYFEAGDAISGAVYFAALAAFAVAQAAGHRQSRPSRSVTLKESPKRQTETFEQLSYLNMLTLNTLVELPTETSVVTSKPDGGRVKTG